MYIPEYGARDISEFFNNFLFSDLCFMVSSDHETAVPMFVQKSILAKFCTYFQGTQFINLYIYNLVGMLTHGTQEAASSTIDVSCTSVKLFSLFIKHVYRFNISKELTTPLAADLWALADQYVYEDLKQLCVDFITKNMNDSTILDFDFIFSPEASELFNSALDEQLKRRCIQYIQDHSDSLEYIGYDTLLTVIQAAGRLGAQLIARVVFIALKQFGYPF
jgi:hypothetical protein